MISKDYVKKDTLAVVWGGRKEQGKKTHKNNLEVDGRRLKTFEFKVYLIGRGTDVQA